ncbi:hypothetical protein [Thermoactinospora rubra]|uniref:hypothetical protein n=1 Tax=Thermoactinospora rubra TaxID=1088767 RepID=UPI000A10CFC2|nr:hypothetical protein [Thermoactinospora rubra]
MRKATLAAFGAIQAILLAWWAAYHPGLFSRDSVLYLSHTVAGPWVSDHSWVYDALLWLSFTVTGDLAAVTLLQTTAMAAALVFLAVSLRRVGAPPRATLALAVLLPLLPPVGAFTVTLWKDVPFTLCVMTACAVACRPMTGRTVLALGALLLGVGLFRPNGFMVAGVALVLLLIVVRGRRVRLAAVGAAATALPILLTAVVLPKAGIQPPAPTTTYQTAFADLGYVYRRHPLWFDQRDLAVLTQVAPLSRWWKAGECGTVNETIWRADFDRTASDRLSGELMGIWLRLLRTHPGELISARLCRGAIAWRISAYTDQGPSGLTYHFSRRPTADSYVGPGKIADFPGRAEVFTLRPLWPWLYGVADAWVVWTYSLDWLLWRGALWCYVTYAALGLAALARRDRAMLAAAAVVAGQQISVLVNSAAQDFRYMASPIYVGMLMLPLLVVSLWRLGRSIAHRNRVDPGSEATIMESA